MVIKTELVLEIARPLPFNHYHIYPAIRQGFSLSRMTSKFTKSVLRNFAMIQVLPFLNNPKDLDLSYKMDLGFWDFFGEKNPLSYK